MRVSMDGKGHWVDNVFVERLWRSVKYEDIYLHAYDTVREAKAALATISVSTMRAGRTRASSIKRRTRGISEPTT